jgi:hypothetical protein
VGSRSLTSSFKIFNTAVFVLKLVSEIFIDVCRKRKEFYDLSNSMHSGNLHKKFWEEFAEEMNETESKCCGSFVFRDRCYSQVIFTPLSSCC